MYICLCTNIDKISSAVNEILFAVIGMSGNYGLNPVNLFA